MVELLEVTLLILCGPVDRLVWVEVAQTEKLSYIHSMYLCVIICTCVTASASRDACIHTCTCTYGVAAAVWVFGVRLGVCGEERLLCGKEFSLRVCGDEITVQGRIQDFRGGGVPTLYINRYMSWEAGGRGVSVYMKTRGGGGGGGCKGGGISYAMGGAAAAAPAPKPGLTGKGVRVVSHQICALRY